MVNSNGSAVMPSKLSSGHLEAPEWMNLSPGTFSFSICCHGKVLLDDMQNSALAVHPSLLIIYAFQRFFI